VLGSLFCIKELTGGAILLSMAVNWESNGGLHMQGFDTIGNAILIAYDGPPILATDPWIIGSAFFGSWGLSHAIPEEQLYSIAAARFIWYSHGHPDHLNPDSLPLCKQQQILLPDHVGGRIASQLRNQGFSVQTLPDNQWVPLSRSIKVLCQPDKNQDAVLLVDIAGTLVVNVNDSADRGSRRLTSVISEYDRSFLLRPSSLGDATMINFFDESGHRVPTVPELQRAAGVKPGERLANAAESFGVTDVIPFSAMHRYQRSDSVWANEHTTSLEEHALGFESPRARLLPAFVRVDFTADEVTPLRPDPAPAVVLPAMEFDDDYEETLEADEVNRIAEYFCRMEHVTHYLDFINFRVGGIDNRIEFCKRKFKRGITFEAPRASLLRAVNQQVFDDLLIGNFTKTTLHGKWPSTNLYPDFVPYVGKYADNGQAHSRRELSEYFLEYRRRMGPIDYLRLEIEAKAMQTVRRRIPRDTRMHSLAEQTYWHVRRGFRRR
jgi:hypothetical protein